VKTNLWFITFCLLSAQIPMLCLENLTTYNGVSVFENVTVGDNLNTRNNTTASDYVTAGEQVWAGEHNAWEDLAPDTVETDTSRIAQGDFMYADNPRYTFLGKTPYRESEFQLAPTIALTAAYATVVIALHINQSNAWWKDPAGGWSIKEDLQYARGLDKFGHIFSSYFASSISSDVLFDCGVERKTAVMIGTGMGIAYTLYVEMEDGFAANWGFSPSDAVANFAGAYFYLAQQHIPFLQNFSPRWGYVPVQWVGGNDINERPKTFIDDYNSTTFWLACNVNNILPTSMDNYWPDWLQISLGYGISNYAVNDAAGIPLQVKRKFLIGLDYDWVKIIPESSIGLLNYLRQSLNLLRLPGPTLEFGDNGVKFGIFYPFAIVVRM